VDADTLGALATRFAWLGAVGSLFAWALVAVQVWQIEGSRHHLVARTLSSLTMILLDVAVIIFFWPGDVIPPIVRLNALEARSLVAFVVGCQIISAYWQLTAPKQGRVRRTDGSRSD
jgi:NADH:ubiquinone oxidoreductase subunit 6 (subunit J)